jgi:hypothetical protein
MEALITTAVRASDPTGFKLFLAEREQHRWRCVEETDELGM